MKESAEANCFSPLFSSLFFSTGASEWPGRREQDKERQVRCSYPTCTCHIYPDVITTNKGETNASRQYKIGR